MSALEHACSQSKQAYALELAASALPKAALLEHDHGIATVVTVVTGQVVVDIALQALCQCTDLHTLVMTALQLDVPAPAR